jgi:hypothetical protein
MSHLIPGEYDVTLNGVPIHYTVRGSGPDMIAHSGGPGMDARTWDDFAGIDDFVTIVAMHPRGSGLSGSAAGRGFRDLQLGRRTCCPITPLTCKPCASI